MVKLLTLAKYKNKFPFLKEVDSLALANPQLNLAHAYKNFFAKTTNFPTFQSRRAKQSYTTNLVNSNIKLKQRHIRLPKLKDVKLKQHREILADYKIISCTISKTKTGKYYIAILTEYEKDINPVKIRSVVGVNFAMNGLYVDSEQDEKANYPNFYRQSLDDLVKEQRI